MAKKNLPIKLFQKRQKVDDRRVEGGGSKAIPKWIVSRKFIFINIQYNFTFPYIFLQRYRVLLSKYL